VWAKVKVDVKQDDEEEGDSLDRVFNCKPRTCPVGKVLMKKIDYQHSAKGCPKMKHDLLSGLMGGGGGGQPMPSKACIEHEICYQTCGKTSQECDTHWNDAQKDHCGENGQMCRLQVMLAGNLRVPEENISECDVYDKGQFEGCTCVKEEDREEHMLKAVKAFYKQSKKLTKEKLDENGEIPEEQREEIKKKWKGKESELFLRLAMKYWKNTSVIRRIEKADPSEQYGHAAKAAAEAARRSHKSKDDDDDDDDNEEYQKVEL